METLTNIKPYQTDELQPFKKPTQYVPVMATPKERLHSVEEFVEKLEQAVLEGIKKE